MGMKQWRLLTLPAAAVILLTACGGDDSDGEPGSLDNDPNQTEDEGITEDEEDGTPEDNENGTGTPTDGTPEDEENDESEDGQNAEPSEDESQDTEGAPEDEDDDLPEGHVKLANGTTGDLDELDTMSNGNYMMEGYMTEEEQAEEMARIESEDEEVLGSSMTMGESKDGMGRYTPNNPLADVHNGIRDSQVPDADQIVDDESMKQQIHDQFISAYQAVAEHNEMPEFSTERADAYQELVDEYFFDDTNNVNEMISIVRHGWSGGVDDLTVSDYAENTYYWQMDLYNDDGDYMGTLVGRYYDVIETMDLTSAAYTDQGARILTESAESDFAGE